MSFSRQYLKTIHSEFKKIDKTFVPAKPNFPDRKQVQINDDVIVLQLWKFNNRRQAISRIIAERVAEKNTSDPFIYDRVMSHLLNNVVVPEDYGFKAVDL